MKDIIKYADIRQQLKDLRRNGIQAGPKTGWDAVTELYRPERGYMTVVTGIPNHGKSRWLDALRINLSCLYGWTHATFSPENYPLHTYYAQLVETVAGTQASLLPDDIWDDKVAFVDEHFHFVYPPEDRCTIDGLLEVFSRIHDNYGCDSILIDPYNEIEHRRPSNIHESEYVSLFLTKIRRFARERNVHVWLVAHPMKLQKDKDGRYPVPTPYDISGSAHFRNKADFCLAVHRPAFGEKDDYVELHVQKVRFRNNGKPGLVEMSFNWQSGRYAEHGSKLFNLPGRAE